MSAPPSEQALNAFGLRDPQDVARPAHNALQQLAAQSPAPVA
jgi:hypothetical protein